MLERFFLKPQTIDRIMGCWLGPQIELYVTILCEQGYSPRSILRRVPILTEFADFTGVRNINQVEQAEALIGAFVIGWVSARRTDRSAGAGRRARNFARGIVRHFFSLAISQSEYHNAKSSWADPFAAQVPGFFEYLDLARSSVRDDEIAKTLTNEGHRSPNCENKVLPITVSQIRRDAGIKVTEPRNKWSHGSNLLSAPELAGRLDIPVNWLYVQIRQKRLLIDQQPSGADLFQDTPAVIDAVRNLRNHTITRLDLRICQLHQEGHQHA